MTRAKLLVTICQIEWSRSLEYATENFDQTLGWTQLTNKSGFSKEQLVELFQLYKQVTPMAFIRHVRQQHKNNLTINLQPDLFEKIKN